MNNFPAWAAALYGLMEAPKMAKGVTDVWEGINDLRYKANMNEDLDQLNQIKTIQDLEKFKPQASDYKGRIAVETLLKDKRDQLTQGEAANLLSKFQKDYENVAGTNNTRFLADPSSRQSLVEAGLQFPQSNNQLVQAGVNDLINKGRAAQAIYGETGQNENLAELSDVYGEKALSESLGRQKAIEENAMKQQEAASKEKAQANLAGFYDAVGGLNGQTRMPAEQERLGSRGGYAPLSEVMGDIQQAASDYGVPAEAVNKEVDNTRLMYEKTYLPPESGKVGRTSYTGQRNLLGDFRRDAQSVAPVINNSFYTAGGPDAIASWSDRIANGQATITDVPRQSRDMVIADLGKRYPNANLSELKANQKYQTAQSNLQSRALIQGVEPLYDQLLTTGKALGNTRIPGVNRVVNWAKEQSGNPDIVAFNNLRDDVIAESERVLLGSGVLSDSKYMRAVKNVNSAQSYPQLQAAVNQLRLTVRARLDALDKKPYPVASQQKQQAIPNSATPNKKTPISSFWK